MATNLPSITDVNSAKGDDLRTMYKQIFGEKTASKDSAGLRNKIIAHLKTVAKAPANGTTKKDDGNAMYAQNMRAAEDAEKKGEWLTATLAWEAAAKLTVGKGKEQCLERAAKARINAKAPKNGASGGAGATDKSAAKEARAAKIAEVKAEREAKAAAAKEEREKKATTLKEEREKKNTEKEAAKAKAKEERETARATKKAEREAAKAKTFEHDERIAHMVGKTIVHDTRGGDHYEIKVLEDGFEYEGEKYKSLSAIGKGITGKSTNGFVFFGLVSAPRPELKDQDAIITAYTEARKGLGADVPQSLEKVLAASVVEAHEVMAAIEANAADLATRAKALRTACRLIEAKKGRAA